MLGTQATQRAVFRNVMLATDFSAAARSAIPYAAGLAESFGANLYVMHVHEPANYSLPPEMWQAVQATHDMETQSLRDEVKQEFTDITPQILEGEGGVWSAMASAIEKRKIDLIVVGTRGRTGLAKAVLGSQAEEVLRRAPCPVLTVGPQAKCQNGKFGKITSILFATNFGPASLAAASIAVSLAEEYQSQLNLLHVVEDSRAYEAAASEEFIVSTECRLRDLVQTDAKAWCTPAFTVEIGVAADKILEVARRINADLIVLGVHGPQGVPGASTHLPIATVHKIVANASCPVLTLRQRAN